jgi:hypothetical protein
VKPVLEVVSKEAVSKFVAGTQLVEQRLGLLSQIERVEASGEPAIDRSEKAQAASRLLCYAAAKVGSSANAASSAV